MARFDDSLLSSPDESENIYTVTEISDLLRQILESEFPSVNIIGEVRNLTIHSSGHIYYTLRDENSMISAVIFRKTAEFLPFVPEDGQSIIASGRITHYGGQGRTQLITYAIVPAGRGLMEIEFRRALKRLMEDGLTAEERKRPIPEYPERIAVITSPTGAVIKDIKRTIARRWPITEMVLIPCEVQGDRASESIIKAFKILNGLDGIDIVILARGGGSIEDLWAFNREDVARAVANSKFPVITGIGHEIDTTLVDYVSDLRAATPTAAAELATPDINEVLGIIKTMENKISKSTRATVETASYNLMYLVKNNVFMSIKHTVESGQLLLDDTISELDSLVMSTIEGYSDTLEDAMDKVKMILKENIRDFKSTLSLARGRLPAVSPVSRVRIGESVLEHNLQLLKISINGHVKGVSSNVGALMRELSQLSPANVLKRGYSVCMDKDGKELISRVSELEKDMEMIVNFFDGNSLCRVKKVRKGSLWLKR